MTRPTASRSKYRPEHLVQSFREHLKATGAPHLWDHHSNTKPEKEGIEVLLPDFFVPREFRRNGRIPCPICSPNAPKYFKGHLLWSPVNDTFHAVGHCCGMAYFGEAVFRQGLRVARDRDELIKAETFLETHWKKPEEFSQYADELFGHARAHDAVVRALRTGISSEIRKEILQLCADSGGYLSIMRDGPRSDRGALTSFHERFGEGPLRGYKILYGSRGGRLTEARLRNAVAPLAPLKWETLEDAQWDIASAELGEVPALAKALEHAAFEFQEVEEEFRALRRFLSQSNLRLLNMWSKAAHGGAGAVSIYHKENIHLAIYLASERRKVLPTPFDLSGAMPRRPKLG